MTQQPRSLSGLKCLRQFTSRGVHLQLRISVIKQLRCTFGHDRLQQPRNRGASETGDPMSELLLFPVILQLRHSFALDLAPRVQASGARCWTFSLELRTDVWTCWSTRSWYSQGCRSFSGDLIPSSPDVFPHPEVLYSAPQVLR